MNEVMVGALGIWSYGAAAVAYLVLAILALAWRREVSLQVACALTAFWAAGVAFLLSTGELLLVQPAVVEVVKYYSWALFFWHFVWSRDDSGRTRAFTILFGIFTGLVAINIVNLVFGLLGSKLEILFGIAIVITSFVFLENFFRNTAKIERWRIKFFAIALGCIFVYDLFFYSSLLLLTRIDFGHIEARGLAYALAAPLIGIAAYRSRSSPANLQLSRQVAFYSTTLLLSGAYIVAMSAAALLIRHLGGSWGAAVQLVFLFSALVLLFVLLSSGAFRAHVKVLIDKHFFQLRYDYREEWLRFTKAISDSTSRYGLSERILHATADTFDSPGSALWLKDGAAYSVVASWNMAVSSVSCAEVEAMAEIMRERGWIVVLDAGGDDDLPDFQVPRALAEVVQGWVLIPLLHHAELTGFIMLAQPRAPKALVWEDFDLMRTVGRQAAGYLAEQQASLALAQAQQFERFNQRSAFVLHDIKNLVSQLSLLTRNIERHGEKPEFRRDMALTLDNVVAKMQLMIDRLSASDVEDASQATLRIDLLPLLAEVAASRAAFYPEEGTERLAVQGDRDRLASLFENLVKNAVEAVQGVEGGWVRVSLLANNDRAIVEISDNGPGMDEAFIRNKLFAPFRSTKSGGFGIGTHQCRVYARELGGDLEVVSSPGSGTTMRVLLPIAAGEPSPQTSPESSLDRQAGE